MKINKFNGPNNQLGIAFDTKKYRYFFFVRHEEYGGTIEKIPMHNIDDQFRFERSELTNLYYDAEKYVFNIRKFWKGWQPKLTQKDVQMLINRIELLEEEIESVHWWLDKMGADRKMYGSREKLSIVGRIGNIIHKIRTNKF